MSSTEGYSFRIWRFIYAIPIMLGVIAAIFFLFYLRSSVVSNVAVVSSPVISMYATQEGKILIYKRDGIIHYGTQFKKGDAIYRINSINDNAHKVRLVYIEGLESIYSDAKANIDSIDEFLKDAKSKSQESLKFQKSSLDNQLNIVKKSLSDTQALLRIEKRELSKLEAISHERLFDQNLLQRQRSRVKSTQVSINNLKMQITQLNTQLKGLNVGEESSKYLASLKLQKIHLNNTLISTKKRIESEKQVYSMEVSQGKKGLVVNAPRDSYLIKSYVHSGTTVQPGALIMKLGSCVEDYVNVYMTKREASDLRPQDTVKIVLANGDRVRYGVVKTIDYSLMIKTADSNLTHISAGKVRVYIKLIHKDKIYGCMKHGVIASIYKV